MAYPDARCSMPHIVSHRGRFVKMTAMSAALTSPASSTRLEIRRPFLGLKMDGIGASNELHAEPGPN